MPDGGGTSVWLFVAVAGFAVLIAAVVWLAFRQRRSLDAWLERKVQAEGWLMDPEHSPVSPERSRWFAVLRTAGFGPLSGLNAVAIDRLAVNPRPGLLEAAFILARVGRSRSWRLRPRSGWPRQQVGLGIVARLPRPVGARVVFIPQPAGAARLWQRLTGFDLPSVPLDDARVNENWTAFADDADAAAGVLAREPGLRAAMVVIAERVLGRQWQERRLPLGGSLSVGRTPRANFLVVELDGARAYLFAGPKAVNQDPFPALAEAARALADSLA